MDRKEIRKIIKENVTLKIAIEWYKAEEKIACFEEAINEDLLRISSFDYDGEESEEWQYALDRFEKRCELLLIKKFPLKSAWHAEPEISIRIS